VITSLVRKQLIAFWSISAVAAVVLALVFMRVPAMLGWGRYTAYANFAQGAGIYPGAEVNYLGTPVGTVKSVDLTTTGVRVKMSLENGTAIPINSTAAIHSVSAVGEQYVEIDPPKSGASSNALAEGATIPVARTTYPVDISTVLHNVSSLVNSLPSGDLASLLAETSTALNGQITNAHTILDGATSLVGAATKALPATERLLTDSNPLLSTVNASSQPIANLMNHLASVSTQLRQGDASLRALLTTGPDAAVEAVGLLKGLEPLLPTLLKPLDSIAGVLGTYRNYLAQLLTDYPIALAEVQSVTLPNGNLHAVNLTLANADKPPECTQGFLPTSKWLLPDQAGSVYTPLYYCTLAPNDGSTIRGARNIPCPNDPARRAATPKLCKEY
jgi:phospholipid/cholesterol/gamma-HCH transport system substrate-binding protein